ncbi:ABC transporter permease [Streptomyces sp. AK02-01A]|uniref:ABC transporter permease n=1 Tax=Streptomyces sp. AK02-01A TaxID=3028648 RepID=UPI00299FE374|nr:ABC transporter permease [Streptomyces sp. AK02-01A]MDX3850387.1 ABC transporter permease [Streptomyces sp. AK02-01A]
MKTWFHSWRAAVRIARRDAWRFKGRSFLVLAMIALPILGVSAADLTLRSAELSTEESLSRSLGRADARFTDPSLGGAPLLQSPDGQSYSPVGDFDENPWPEGAADFKKAVPPGGTVLEDTLGSAKLRTTHGLLPTEIRELKAADPMARGIMRLDSGRFPEKAGEVAATTHFLETSGLRVGSKLTARGLDADYRIVGAYELPDVLKTDQVTALPGAMLDPLDKALEADGLPGTDQRTTLLVNVPGGFTWNMVQQVNTHGITVDSRAVALAPPADSDVPLYQQEGWGDRNAASSATELAVAATIVGLAMLEICLLAGPAFAVGARRSRRQLGLVGANGGDRRHIRAIVLAGGLVIGVAAAVTGTALGIALTYVLRPVLEEYMGKRFGGFGLRPAELLGIALLAVITGLLAAIVPAVTASRQTVLASLTGRRGVRRSSRVLPVLGLIAFVLGAAIALYGSAVSEQFAIVAGGSAIAELGVVALTPALVGLFGRVGRWLPLSPRLALRDAVRNRGRTAPAVAAVLAAVAGTVAVSTYAASSDAQNMAAYEPQLPRGAVYVMIAEDGGRDVPTVRSAVQKTLPVDIRAHVDRISVGRPSCPVYGGEDGCGRYEVVVPKPNRCPLWETGAVDPATKFSAAERRKLIKDWRCEESGVYSNVDGGVLIGDANVLKVLGINDSAAEKALADGEAVSFDKRNLDTGGKVGIRLITDTDKADAAAGRGQDAPGVVKSFPAHQIPDGQNAYGLSMLLTPAAAKSAGIGTVPLGAYYTTSAMPDSAQEQKLNSEIDKTGTEATLHIERGYVSESDITLLALTVFAGLITIGAAGIATGLAQADAESDLKTLAAVGAPERVRRTLSGFQCAVVAVMGVLLGSAAGVLPAVGLRLTQRREGLAGYQRTLKEGLSDATAPYVPVVIPWETLAVLLIAVPLGAAVLAALVTRSHRTLGRRAAA